MKSDPPEKDGAEQRFRDEQYALLVDAVRDYALFALSLDGLIRTWNTGAERIMGYEAAEVIGRPFSIFYGEEDIRHGKPDQEIETATANGRVEDEGWRIRKDGTRFWANTVITALYDEEGNHHGFAKVTRDFTERRTAEEELRRSEEMFRLLVSSVQDYAIFMLDPMGLIMSWNDGARNIKGYDRQDVIGKHFSIFYTPEALETGRPSQLLETAVREDQVIDEGWRVRKDGTRFWANVLITAIRNAEGELRGFAKITRDLTRIHDAQRLERAFEEAEHEKAIAEAAAKAALEASQAKDEFLMVLSHELRTPLTSILGWSRLLPEIDPDDEALDQGLEAISRGAQLQARLVDDVLVISSVIAGKLRLDKSESDLRTAIENAVDQISDNASDRNIDIDVDISDDLGTAFVDHLRIQQVVWNLLANAVKFSDRGTTVRLQAHREGDELRITVEDEGEGIEPDFLPEIFDAFRQSDMGPNRTHGGLGLGLTIAHHLVEAHGGEIRAESQGKEQGSRFEVTIPIRLSPADSPLRPTAPDLTGLDHRLDDYTVLLVDDNEENRLVISKMIEEAGGTVVSVATVNEAVFEYSRVLPDIVLTDVAMPERGGEDLLREIKSSPDTPAVPVVGISSFDRSAIGGGDDFDRFLRKPIDPFELVATIEDVLS